MGATQPKHHHSDRDRIWTPPGLAKVLALKIPAEVGDTWLEPCYGTGNFYDAFPTNHKDFCELDMGKDYFDNTKKYDWVVTNIPFSQPKVFIEKMSDDCIKGFGILCLANSMTATRLKMLEGKGLYVHSVTTVYVKEWGFGYRTYFYVFTREKNPSFETIIQEKELKGGQDE
jgi:hypothetical protein